MISPHKSHMIMEPADLQTLQDEYMDKSWSCEIVFELLMDEDVIISVHIMYSY